KRPTVQVGDPFTEKLLLEACLELMREDAIVAIQDMGAAGLTSSSVEMAAKGGSGIELDLDHVPQREAEMTAYEMMLSESQERMLMVLKPGCEDVGARIFAKWELDFAVIGRTTDTGRLVLRHQGETVADLPVGALSDAAPSYDRPWTEHTPFPPLEAAEAPAPNDPGEALLRLVASPDLASRRWIWEQYDHTVMADTAQMPGGDAAVVRVHGTNKGLAIATDVTSRYCAADPLQGGRQAVAECWRNLTAAGATPLALTDCLNFGSPERPAIMGQFVGCIKGMGEACAALDFPVVSGNVSLYNETNGQAILPTPAVGGVGLIADLGRMATPAFKAAGEVILLIGETRGHLGQSLYLREIAGREDGPPPPVDLGAERRNGDFVRGLIESGTATAVHDLSGGGLAVALAEMALAGNLGAEIALPEGAPVHAFLFGEDQARYLVTVSETDADGIAALAKEQSVPVTILGRVLSEPVLKPGAGAPVALETLRAAHENWLPDLMTEMEEH
ncbi:MAG: phosphoribosylformylglycinamidine synthase subunit PurL, partial [Alphaproteobacteria bacterium]